MTDLLHRILAGSVPAFALLHRPESGPHGHLDVLSGPVTELATQAELPIARRAQPGPAVLAVLPYRQLTERGFACVDDGTPLLAMAIAEHDTPPVAEALVATGLVSSVSEARRAISQGGVSLDGERVADDSATVQGSLPGGVSVLRRGKKTLAGVFLG